MENPHTGGTQALPFLEVAVFQAGLVLEETLPPPVFHAVLTNPENRIVNLNISIVIKFYLKEGIHKAMSCCKMPYKARSVHSYITTLRAAVRNFFCQQRRDLIFKVDCKMI